MNQDKWNELQAKLYEPFPAAVIGWVPSATSRDKALGGAYITPRDVSDRLNAVMGLDWSEDYSLTIGTKSVVVECRLTIMGATRVDIGTKSLVYKGEPIKDPVDKNVFTAAYAQAFKRAAVKFGIGAYLYRLPKKWVAFDPQKKKFTNGGLADLNAVYLQYVKKAAESKAGKPERPQRQPPVLRIVEDPEPEPTPEPESDQIDWAMTYPTSKGTLFGDLKIDSLDWVILKAKKEAIKAANIVLDHKLAVGGFGVVNYKLLLITPGRAW